ncbi:MAG: hypothetical protein AABW79_00845 [Nanoarchaeota archaeon]
MGFSKMPEPICGLTRFIDQLQINGYDYNSPDKDIIQATFNQ